VTSVHSSLPRYAQAVGAVAVSALLLAGSAAAPALADSSDSHDSREHGGAKQQHVLLLSVDGLHQKDLDWYVTAHPHSAFAAIVGNGTSYTNAQTPVPSDSFPGLIGQVTGGNPGTTGIYYDDTYNRALLPQAPRTAPQQHRGPRSPSPKGPIRIPSPSMPERDSPDCPPASSPSPVTRRPC
jgi:hypothetical protein